MSWRAWYASDDDENTHVTPAFGPEHVLADECWCHPERDDDVPTLLLHHVAQ